MTIDRCERALGFQRDLTRFRLFLLGESINKELERIHRDTRRRIDAYRDIYETRADFPPEFDSVRIEAQRLVRETPEWKECRRRARRLLGVTR